MSKLACLIWKNLIWICIGVNAFKIETIKLSLSSRASLSKTGVNVFAKIIKNKGVVAQYAVKNGYRGSKGTLRPVIGEVVYTKDLKNNFDDKIVLTTAKYFAQHSGNIEDWNIKGLIIAIDPNDGTEKESPFKGLQFPLNFPVISVDYKDFEIIKNECTEKNGKESKKNMALRITYGTYNSKDFQTTMFNMEIEERNSKFLPTARPNIGNDVELLKSSLTVINKNEGKGQIPCQLYQFQIGGFQLIEDVDSVKVNNDDLIVALSAAKIANKSTTKKCYIFAIANKNYFEDHKKLSNDTFLKEIFRVQNNDISFVIENNGKKTAIERLEQIFGETNINELNTTINNVTKEIESFRYCQFTASTKDIELFKKVQNMMKSYAVDESKKFLKLQAIEKTWETNPQMIRSNHDEIFIGIIKVPTLVQSIVVLCLSVIVAGLIIAYYHYILLPLIGNGD